MQIASVIAQSKIIEGVFTANSGQEEQLLSSFAELSPDDRARALAFVESLEPN